MKHEDFLEAYVPELQLLDALEELKNYSFEAAETIDQLVYPSNTARISEESHQMDPNR